MRVDVVTESKRVGSMIAKCVGVNLVGFGQHIIHYGKSTGEFPQHSDVLGPLPWKQNAERPGQRPSAIVRPVGCRPGFFFRIAFQHRQAAGNQFGKVGLIPLDDKQHSLWMSGLKLRATFESERTHSRPFRLGQRRQLRSDVVDQVVQIHR